MNIEEAFSARAATYDATRRLLIPCFDDFYRIAVEQAPHERDAAIEVLDLGAGTGLLSAFFAEAYPRARFTLVDVSDAMLDQARERFGGDSGRFQYRVLDYASSPLPGEFDLIVSCLSIHHLSDDEKRALFRKARGGLRTGGAFINADEVLGATPDVEARNQTAWLREARSRGATEDDLTASMGRMNVFDQTAAVEDQLRWLADAGFRDVDCAYKYYMFAVMSGRV